MKNYSKPYATRSSRNSPRHDPSLDVDKEYAHAKNSVLHFLSFRSRSTQEVALYLKKKQISKNVAERVIGELSGIGFIDDKKFVDWWVESRMNTGYGPLRISSELKQKGIALSLIHDAIQQDWNIVAGKIAMKLQSRCATLPIQEQQMKVKSALMRRGFQYSTASAAVDELCLTRYNTH